MKCIWQGNESNRTEDWRFERKYWSEWLAGDCWSDLWKDHGFFHVSAANTFLHEPHFYYCPLKRDLSWAAKKIEEGFWTHIDWISSSGPCGKLWMSPGSGDYMQLLPAFSPSLWVIRTRKISAIPGSLFQTFFPGIRNNRYHQCSANKLIVGLGTVILDSRGGIDIFIGVFLGFAIW